MPFVDRGVELKSGISAGPSGFVDRLPQLTGFQRTAYFSIGTLLKFPVIIIFYCPQKIVGQAYRVVAILPGNRGVSLRVPVGVILFKLKIPDPLLRQLNNTINVVFWNKILYSSSNRFLESGILFDIEAVALCERFIPAGEKNFLEPSFDDAASCSQRSNLTLFPGFPVNKLLYVGVVDIESHHLGGTSCGPTRLNSPCRAIANLEKTHESRRFTTARKRLALATQVGKIGTGARSKFEQPCLLLPQVHDSTFPDKIILNGKYEAGVGLRTLVSVFGFFNLVGFCIEEIMSLSRTLDTISPVKTRIKPLRRIWGGHLACQHMAHLIVIVTRLSFVFEALVLPAPIGPATRQAVKHLTRIAFATTHPLRFRKLRQCFSVYFFRTKPFGDAFFLFPLQSGRNSRLAKILLSHDIYRHLRPRGGYHHLFHLRNG